ncbi:hypothetical protein HK096_002428 [Nowakowskiella sp. JEL0078]|nr:hypothetical protein HK096_002428 [Nowakowskiella sp. JEL0078]
MAEETKRPGTILVILGTTALTLPSLFSTYYKNIGLSEPPLSRSFVKTHGYFTYKITGTSLTEAVDAVVKKASTSAKDLATQVAGKAADPTGIFSDGFFKSLGSIITPTSTNTGAKKAVPLQRTVTIVSAPHTLVTHMFHHSDFLHWGLNIISMSSTAWNLDLGFYGTSGLLLGGGIVGCLSHLFERRNVALVVKQIVKKPTDPNDVVDVVISAVRKYTNSASNFLDIEFVPTRTFMLCGLSAGVYSLVGAEFYRGLKELAMLVRDVKKRGFVSNFHKSQLENLMWNLGSRVISMVAQFVAISEQVDQDVSIGHSAHIGGFLFGISTMFLVDFFKLDTFDLF